VIALRSLTGEFYALQNGTPILLVSNG